MDQTLEQLECCGSSLQYKYLELISVSQCPMSCSHSFVLFKILFNPLDGTTIICAGLNDSKVRGGRLDFWAHLFPFWEARKTSWWADGDVAMRGSEACWEGLDFHLLKGQMHMHQTPSEQPSPPAHPYCSVPSSLKWGSRQARTAEGRVSLKKAVDV